MTDTAPEQTEDWSDVETSADATYPEYPDNPHNHLFTLSMDGRGPMIVVRGNTPQELNARLQELQDAGTTTLGAAVYSHMKAEMQVAQGLGPVSAVPAPQAAPAAPSMPTPPPFGPNVSVPGAPGFQGNPGFPAPPAPPAAPAVQNNAPEFQQNGWYRLTVPYPKKGAFDAVVQQYGMRKGRPTEGGAVSFNKADKSWYVSPQYAGAFGEFSPMPA
jgi:hypothetical protein